MISTIKEFLLGDLIEIASGQVDPRESPYAEMPHVGGDNIESHTGQLSGIQSAAALGLSSGKYLFSESDILYSKIRPNLNKVAAPDFSGICSADIYPIRPIADKIEKRYLVYVLRSKGFLAFAEQHSTRTNIPKINRNALLSYRVPLPPLPEQKRIADILDRADAIRRKRQEALDALLSIPGSTFHEMFGTPLHNTKGWKLGTIRDLVSEVKYGSSSKASSHGEYPMLRMNNITYAGTWDLTDLKYIDIPAEDRAKYLVQKGDILFNRTNSKELVGKTAVFQEDTPMAFAGYLVRARTNKLAHPDYIAGYLNSPHGKATLRHMCKSIVGMANINAQEFQDIAIPQPPLKAQLEFVQVLDVVRQSEKPCREALAMAESLFSSLVQRAFQGEVSQ